VRFVQPPLPPGSTRSRFRYRSGPPIKLPRIGQREPQLRPLCSCSESVFHAVRTDASPALARFRVLRLAPAPVLDASPGKDGSKWHGRGHRFDRGSLLFQVDQGGSRSTHGLPSANQPSTRPQLCNKLLHNCRHTEATISFPKTGYSSSCRSRRRVSISPRSLVTTSSRSSTVGTSSRMGAGSSRVTR
jgi:hypothetical protein